LAAIFAAGRDADVAFFFVAMLLFPPRRLRQNDGLCLAFIHKTGKSRGTEFTLARCGSRMVS
jgi:hypothetical protein